MVTGAGRGIGRAIAQAAAAAGYRVGVLDRHAAAAVAVAKEINDRRNGSHPEAEAVPLVVDVADEAGVEVAFDAFGAVPDLLVNNAGIVRFGPLLDLGLADWQAVLDVNLTGTFICARAAARRMVAGGTAGVIVNITSMNGVAPGPNAGAYGATKSAVALLTQQMALEWGRARHPGQRRGSRPHRRRDVRAHLRRPRLPGAAQLQGPAGPAGDARGHRPGRALPGLARGGLHHRRRTWWSTGE